MANDDKYRQMIDEDFQEAPLTDEQLGEQAGINSYNEAVEPYNKAEKAGRLLRKQHSEEAQKQINEDAEKYYQSKPLDESMKYETPQTNLFLKNLGPDGAQSLVDSIINGDPSAHIQYMTERSVAQNGVEGTRQSIEDHAGLGRSPAGFVEDLLAPKVNQYQTPMAPPIAQGGTTQVQTQQPYIVPSAKVPIPVQVNTKPVEEIGGKAREQQAEVSGIQQALPQMAQTEKRALQAKGQAQQDAYASQYLQEGVKQAYLQKYADDQMKQFMDIANKKYDITEIKPDRVWDNKSDASKALLILGTALLGSRGSNAGFQVMQNMIEKDIEAQKDKNLNERSLIAKNYEIMRMIGTTHAGAIKSIADSMGKQATIVQQAKLAGANLNEDVLNNQIQKSLTENLLKTGELANKLLGTEKGAESEAINAKVQTEKMKQEAISKNIDIRFKQLEASTKSPEDVNTLKSLSNMHNAKERIAMLLNEKGKSPADKMRLLSGKIGLSSDPEMDRALQELANAEVAASGATGARGKEKYIQIRNELEPKLLDAFSKGNYNNYLAVRIEKQMKANAKFSKEFLSNEEIKRNFPELMQYKVMSQGAVTTPAEKLKKKAQELKKGK